MFGLGLSVRVRVRDKTLELSYICNSVYEMRLAYSLRYELLRETASKIVLVNTHRFQTTKYEADSMLTFRLASATRRSRPFCSDSPGAFFTQMT